MTVPNNRIDELFARAREEQRPALVLYLTSGFPDEATTRRLLPVLEEAGCDLLELGVPFSDPIADGPVIQKASAAALKNGISFERTLAILREFRQQSTMAVVLFGALNPFLHHGLENSARDAAAAGADGFLAADLPVEEANDFRTICHANGLHLILLAAPTSPDERLRAIAAASSGFLYCISLKGITGADVALGDTVRTYMQRVRAAAPSVPLALGFGIGKPAQAAEVAPWCDAVVVGTALVKLIETCQKEGLPLEKTVGEYVRSMAAALRKPVRA